MRALKTILIILGVLLALVIILGLTGSDTYRYERSVTIAAPADAVYEHVASLGAMDKWSPWNDLDPNVKKSIEGTDGAVGAVAKWEGNDDIGKGEQRLDTLVPGKLVRTHLTFLEPWQQECGAGIDLAQAGDSTKVTWFMVGENNFMGKVMGVFMDMDAMIGKDFEKGLGRLKSIAEEDAAKAREERDKLLAAYTIETGERPATLYVGVRKTIKWAEMKQFLAESFGATGAAMRAAKVKPAGTPTGVYFKWDEVNQEVDVLAGFPIAADAKGKVVAEGITEYESPASTAYWTKYMGGYNNMEPAHMALDAKIKMDGREHHTNVIEEYVTDPGITPDSTQWQTNIIWLAK